jgi:hypothetical protein
MPVDWNSREMAVWQEHARNQQQDYFHLIGGRKWTEYKPSDYVTLRRNIGYAVFGAPGEEPNETNGYTGYKRRHLSYIDKVFDVIKNYKQQRRNQEVICVSFLFVYGIGRDGHVTFPVIGVYKYNSLFEHNIYIDSCARVYKNWQDYLENNKLPECALCYPSNGVYSAVNGQVQVEFGISPAGKTSRKVLQGLDTAGGVLGLGASGVAVAAIFMPVTLPTLLG